MFQETKFQTVEEDKSDYRHTDDKVPKKDRQAQISHITQEQNYTGKIRKKKNIQVCYASTGGTRLAHIPRS